LQHLLRTEQLIEDSQIHNRHLDIADTRVLLGDQQELMLRGSVDFANVDEYRRFPAAMLERLNAGRRQRSAEEMAVMRELPERRMESTRRGQGAACPVGPRR
jgi:hypothetical protein